MSSFSELIKELRIKKQLTQKVIAQAVEITERTYISLENGNTKPSLDTVTKLADYYSISIDYLLGRDNYWQNSEDHTKVKTPPDILNSDITELKKNTNKKQ